MQVFTKFFPHGCSPCPFVALHSRPGPVLEAVHFFLQMPNTLSTLSTWSLRIPFVLVYFFFAHRSRLRSCLLSFGFEFRLGLRFRGVTAWVWEQCSIAIGRHSCIVLGFCFGLIMKRLILSVVNQIVWDRMRRLPTGSCESFVMPIMPFLSQSASLQEESTTEVNLLMLIQYYIPSCRILARPDVLISIYFGLPVWAWTIFGPPHHELMEGHSSRHG